MMCKFKLLFLVNKYCKVMGLKSLMILYKYSSIVRKMSSNQYILKMELEV